MNRTVKCRVKAGALPLLLSLWAGCAAGPRLEVWFVDSLEKVFPDDTEGASLPSERWVLPRNGHLNIQLALRPTAAVPDLGVNVRPPELAGRKLSVEVRHAGYVPVGSNPPGTPYDEVIRAAPTLYPDPLLEDFPFGVEAGKTETIWITVYCPPDVNPGDYEGEIELTSGGQVLERESFRVRVVPAAVPREQSLKVTNWFNLDEGSLRLHYNLGSGLESYWKALENIGRVMADHKQNVLITPVTSLTDARIEGGTIGYSFERLDRWIEIFEKAGLLGTIEGGHLLSRASGYHTSMVIPALVIEGGRIVHKALDPDDPRAEQYFNSFLPALYAHLKERGWTGRYIQHIHDEPHDLEAPIYNRYAKIIRRNLPGIPTIDAVGLDQDIRFFAEVCDIWVPVLGSFDHQLRKIDQHLKGGGRAWFYTCIFPQGRYLNRFIDHPLLKVRLLHWFNFRYNFSGFLHWGGNYWGPRPFENVQTVINDNLTLLPAGDNALVYPAPEKLSVLSSIRLETMREGIEDYELLAALARKDPERARRLVERAIPHINDYMRDSRQFHKLREELLEALQ